MSRTKSQSLNVSCILAQLSSLNLLKPGVDLRMKTSWVINNFIACKGATYMRGFTVGWNCLNHIGLWEFPPFFRGNSQSLCIALIAGKCLPLGPCKGLRLLKSLLTQLSLCFLPPPGKSPTPRSSWLCHQRNSSSYYKGPHWLYRQRT